MVKYNGNVPATHFNIGGLTDQEVRRAREKYGSNTLSLKKENSFFASLKEIIKEPMFILLVIASAIYKVVSI